MTTLTPKYSVVLRSDLPLRERQLLEHFCCKITSESGPDLLHFLCTDVDVSHAVYVEMQTFKPGDESASSVRIPHFFVFLISGSEERAPIGFLMPSASEPQ